MSMRTARVRIPSHFISVGAHMNTATGEGKLKPVNAEVLPLARAREAFKHGAEVHSPGKIVLEASAA
jgi:NADPH:quinone reductase-like Zn-dependent oxidoreductase